LSTAAPSAIAMIGVKTAKKLTVVELQLLSSEK